VSPDEQYRVFLPPQDGTRKVILATNIAESSITVPDIKYGEISAKLVENLLAPKKYFQLFHRRKPSKFL
jgi:hypothetical protein